MIEHDRREPLPPVMEGWDILRERRIGDTVIAFLLAGQGDDSTESRGESNSPRLLEEGPDL